VVGHVHSIQVRMKYDLSHGVAKYHQNHHWQRPYCMLHASSGDYCIIMFLARQQFTRRKKPRSYIVLRPGTAYQMPFDVDSCS